MDSKKSFYEAKNIVSLALTAKARKDEYFGDIVGAGLPVLCKAGISYEDANDVIKGRKRARIIAKNEFVIEDDDWTPPDFTEMTEKMLCVLEEIAKKELPENINLRNGALYKRGFALIVHMEVLKSPARSANLYNEFVKFIGRKEDMVDFNYTFL